MQPPLFHLTYVDMPHRHDLPLVVGRLCRQTHCQRHRAHAAGEHDQHVQQLCAAVQLTGNAHRQAHRAKRRAGLEDAVNDAYRIFRMGVLLLPL